MSTFLTRLFWFVTGAFALVCLAGLVTGFGGGDARAFYWILLCGDAVLAGVVLWVSGLHRSSEGRWRAPAVLILLWASAFAASGTSRSLLVRVNPDHTGVLVKDGAVVATLGPGLHWKCPFATFHQQGTLLTGRVTSFYCHTADGSKRPVVVKYGAAIDATMMAPFYARNPNGLVLDARVREAIMQAVRDLATQYRDAELDAKRRDIEEAARAKGGDLLERDHIAITECELAFFSARVP